MRQTLIALCALLAAAAGAQVNGIQLVGPVQVYTIPLSILSVTPRSPQTSSSIEADIVLSTYGTASMSCGTVFGTYTNLSADSNVFTSATMPQIVTGLAASTTYYCKVTATNNVGTATATFTSATTAAASTTAITSYVFSTLTAVGTGSTADTFYNQIGSDGIDYYLNEDTYGWTNGGGSECPNQQGLTFNRFTSISPLQGRPVNCLDNYGTVLGFLGIGSAKSGGVFMEAGLTFIIMGWQCPSNCHGSPSFPQANGQMIMSKDHGHSWNNFQTPTATNLYGLVTTGGCGMTCTMFAGIPGEMGACGFIQYGPDDGTFGYKNSYTQQDNADGYVYLMCTEGFTQGGGSNSGAGGNDLYLIRVARARLPNLTGADYQCFTTGNGSLDSQWISVGASCSPMLTSVGQFAMPAVNYVPTINRYLMQVYWYPSGAGVDASNVNWVIWEAPHPWGPWTTVTTFTSVANACYNPIPIQASGILSGLTFTVICTSDFATTYLPYTATVTLN